MDSEKPHESWEQAMLVDPALVFPRQAGLVNLLQPLQLVLPVLEMLFFSDRKSSYHFPRHLIGFLRMFRITSP